MKTRLVYGFYLAAALCQLRVLFAVRVNFVQMGLSEADVVTPPSPLYTVGYIPCTGFATIPASAVVSASGQQIFCVTSNTLQAFSFVNGVEERIATSTIAQFSGSWSDIVAADSASYGQEGPAVVVSSFPDTISVFNWANYEVTDNGYALLFEVENVASPCEYEYSSCDMPANLRISSTGSYLVGSYSYVRNQGDNFVYRSCLSSYNASGIDYVQQSFHCWDDSQYDEIQASGVFAMTRFSINETEPAGSDYFVIAQPFFNGSAAFVQLFGGSPSRPIATLYNMSLPWVSSSTTHGMFAAISDLGQILVVGNQNYNENHGEISIYNLSYTIAPSNQVIVESTLLQTFSPPILQYGSFFGYEIAVSGDGSTIAVASVDVGVSYSTTSSLIFIYKIEDGRFHQVAGSPYQMGTDVSKLSVSGNGDVVLCSGVGSTVPLYTSA